MPASPDVHDPLPVVVGAYQLAPSVAATQAGGRDPPDAGAGSRVAHRKQRVRRFPADALACRSWSWRSKIMPPR